MNDLLWLSLGENCLPDDVLKRHSRKSFSTPYSSGRSNIDYALQLERTGYDGLLSKENLAFGDAWGTRVVRSSIVVRSDNIFEPGCSKGFEFTHHNPLESESDRLSYERKISRLLDIRGTRNVLFLYHHRQNKNSNLHQVIEKLLEFSRFYSSEHAECRIALFHQSASNSPLARSLTIGFNSKTLIEFIFETEHIWAGADSRIFWGRNDDDLFEEMFRKIDHFTAA